MHTCLRIVFKFINQAHIPTGLFICRRLRIFSQANWKVVLPSKQYQALTMNNHSDYKTFRYKMSPKPCFPTILAGLQDSREGGPPSSPQGRIQGDLACILQVEDQKVIVCVKKSKAL